MTDKPTEVLPILLPADAIDIVVGRNVRRIRQLRKLSMGDLGDALGVSYQQVQKYESGQNRISCSMLQHMSDALGSSISDFFQSLPGFPDSPLRFKSQPPKAEDMALALAISRLPDRSVQQNLHDLIAAIGTYNEQASS